MNPEELLRKVQQAAARGAPADLLDAYVREQSSFQSVAELGASIRQTAVGPGNLARAAGMGASFGFLDELAGLGAAVVPGGQGYREARDEVRSNYNAFQQAHPWWSGAAEMGGGFLLPGGVVAKGAKVAPGFVNALARGIKAGAATGAVAGAGYANELEDIPRQAGLGAGTGAVLGAAFPAVGASVKALRYGTSGARLAGAIEAGGGEAALRRAAGKSVAAGYGSTTPVAALSPYLRAQAEFSATNVPAVYAKYRDPMQRRQASEAERLLRGVSEITGTPEVGRPAIVEARQAQFKPLYEALDKGVGHLPPDGRLEALVNSPYVRTVYKKAVEDGAIAGQVGPEQFAASVDRPGFKPRFKDMRVLREELMDAADVAYTAGQGHRGAALKQAANNLEALLVEKVPQFAKVQRAYYEASIPVNIIDLARLEVAKQGRLSPELSRASRELRRDLLRAFGSPAKYRAFMAKVDQEASLGAMNRQVFGGPDTARRLRSDGMFTPEEAADVVTRASAVTLNWSLARLLGKLIPRRIRERTGKQIGDVIFRPANDIDDVLRTIEQLRQEQSAGALSSVALPAATGFLLGRQ